MACAQVSPTNVYMKTINTQLIRFIRSGATMPQHRERDNDVIPLLSSEFKNKCISKFFANPVPAVEMKASQLCSNIGDARRRKLDDRVSPLALSIFISCHKIIGTCTFYCPSRSVVLTHDII